MQDVLVIHGTMHIQNVNNLVGLVYRVAQIAETEDKFLLVEIILNAQLEVQDLNVLVV